jgi:hypothetical protein
MYAVSSPRAVIKMEKRVKVAVLLNIGADINVMIIKIADVTNLSIFEIIPIETKTFTGHNI